MSMEKIKQILGKGGFLENKEDMEPYLSSWRGGHEGNTPFVALPSSAEEVAEIVKICAESKTPIIPQGGNTGLVGGSIPSASGEELLVNLSRMNKIREIDRDNYTLTAEAGCILGNIQKAAEEAGLLFPLSMASEGSCEAGGFLSTNGGGTAVLHYGNTRDLTLGLEVVLPNGEIWSGLRALRKDNTGYDLKQLFIGAEGTLGIITAGVFKLFPSAKQVATALLAVANLEKALALLVRFREESGDRITAFEIISKTAMGLVAKNVEGAREPFRSIYEYYILVEFSSSTADESLNEKMENILAANIESGLVADALIAESLTHAQEFWHMRESISEAEKKEGQGIHFDISLPISKIPSFIHKTDDEIKQKIAQAKIVSFGHMGDGNIHYNICLPKDMGKDDFLKSKEQLKEIIYANLQQMNGSISAEHGIGIERKDDLAAFKSAAEMTLMKKIKQAIDPHNIMNPGKIF